MHGRVERLSLEERKSPVTGGSSGIGRAIRKVFIDMYIRDATTP